MLSNDIYTILSSSSHDYNEHYLKRYVNFVTSRSTTESYVERHHICPKSMFPEFSDLRKHKWNCAKLSAREHFIAHWMLAKAFGGSMWYALNVMVVGGKTHKRTGLKLNSKLYAAVRENFSKIHSERTRGKRRAGHTEEAILKMKKAKSGSNNPNYGKVVSEAQRKKISAANKGRKRSPEFCELMRQHNAVQPIKSCPHCLKNVDIRNYSRWHGDNCKKAP